jgi:5'(3')-deoxyribonucleotidase
MNNIKKVIKYLFEEGGRSPITVYLDLDGVLADFQGSVDASEEFAKAKQELDRLLEMVPEFEGLSSDELKDALKGQQTSNERKLVKKAFRNFSDLKYIIASKKGFFLNLETLPGAEEMVTRAFQLTGKLPNILTAPIQSHPEQCESEKKAWVEKHFPGMYSEFICTSNKHHYANANSLLIDDRTKYVKPFQDAGGQVILHTSPEDTLSKMDKLLSR